MSSSMCIHQLMEMEPSENSEGELQASFLWHGDCITDKHIPLSDSIGEIIDDAAEMLEIFHSRGTLWGHA